MRDHLNVEMVGADKLLPLDFVLVSRTKGEVERIHITDLEQRADFQPVMYTDMYQLHLARPNETVAWTDECAPFALVQSHSVDFGRIRLTAS